MTEDPGVNAVLTVGLLDKAKAHANQAWMELPEGTDHGIVQDYLCGRGFGSDVAWRAAIETDPWLTREEIQKALDALES